MMKYFSLFRHNVAFEMVINDSEYSGIYESEGIVLRNQEALWTLKKRLLSTNMWKINISPGGLTQALFVSFILPSTKTRCCSDKETTHHYCMFCSRNQRLTFDLKLLLLTIFFLQQIKNCEESLPLSYYYGKTWRCTSNYFVSACLTISPLLLTIPTCKNFLKLAYICIVILVFTLRM